MRTSRLRLILAATAVLLILHYPVLADDAQTHPSQEVFILARPETHIDLSECPLLEREIFRQALLIAARDELNLQTRDAVLRESTAGIDHLPSRSARVQVNFDDKASWLGKASALFIQCTAGQNAPLSLKVKISYVPRGEPDISTLPVQAERYSRGEFVDYLKKSGFSAAPSAPDNHFVLPADEETRLGEMSIFSQFIAVQQAHAAIRQHGEFPAALGVLVRGYANLGQLTRFHWTAGADVFTARSLLYAQRMLAANANDPIALRHRAYALAMAGLHAAALNDLTAAGAGPEQQPAWVKLVGPLCMYDTKGLMKSANDDQNIAGLATYMAFLTVENSGNVSTVLATGKAAFQANPYCERLLDAMCEPAGMGNLHGVPDDADGLTLEVDLLRHELPLQKLPDNVNQAWAAAHANPNLMADVADVSKAFVDAGDVAEPSWSMLGRLLQESNFAHVYREVESETNPGNSDPTDTILKTAPLIAGHPYADLITAFDAKFQRLPVPASLKSLDLSDCSFRMPDQGAWFALISAAGGDTHSIWYLQNLHQEFTAYALEQGMVTSDRNKFDASRAKQFSSTLCAISPHSPVGAYSSIKYDWRHVTDDLLAKWKTEFQDQPCFNRAMATHYLDGQQFAPAIPYLENCVKLAPDHWAFESLANAYLSVRDEANWLKTVQLALKEDDYAMDHAEIDVEVAQYFMARQRYQEALPYADDAAGSGAYWAMGCAARCRTGLNDFQGAEQLLRKLSDDYGSTLDWYFWCRLTGHGDLAAATNSAETFIKDPPDVIGIADYYIARGNTPNAIQLLRKKFDEDGDPNLGSWLALLYDAAGDVANRDAVLNAAAQRGNAFVAEHGYIEDFQFFQVLQKAYTDPAKSFDVPLFERSFSWVPATRSSSLHYFAGEFLLHHGREKEGLAELQTTARVADAISSSGRLARIELHDRGIDPYHLPEPTTQP